MTKAVYVCRIWRSEYWEITSISTHNSDWQSKRTIPHPLFWFRVERCRVGEASQHSGCGKDCHAAQSRLTSRYSKGDWPQSAGGGGRVGCAGGETPDGDISHGNGSRPLEPFRRKEERAGGLDSTVLSSDSHPLFLPTGRARRRRWRWWGRSYFKGMGAIFQNLSWWCWSVVTMWLFPVFDCGRNHPSQLT